MIEFPCRCGFKFSVPEELAGGTIQCPQCKLLADVPGLGEIQEMEPDGTLKVQEIPIKPDEASERFRRAYEERVDENGELDLRPTFEEVVNAGSDEVPLDLAGELRPGAPKYDPETGELIKPMEMTPPPDDIPMADVAPTLNYATDGERPTRLWGIPLRMLLGGNIAALLALLGVHLLLLFFAFLVTWGLVFVIVIPAFLLILILSHFTNLVEEVGVMECNEVPTPGRGMSWSEDIFGPFVKLMMAVLMSWPIIVYAIDVLFAKYTIFLFLSWPHHLNPTWLIKLDFSTKMLALGWAMFFIGSFLFPAIFLTLGTSGTLHNVRPDRVLGVMRACGRMYLLSVLLCVLALPAYWIGLCSSLTLLIPPMLIPAGDTVLPASIAFPLLAIGLYLMHVFCWHLGLCYRARHDKFPWILQWHVSTKKIQRRIPPKRRRRQAGAAAAPDEAQRGAAANLPAGEAPRTLPQPPAQKRFDPMRVEPLPLEPIEREATGNP